MGMSKNWIKLLLLICLSSFKLAFSQKGESAAGVRIAWDYSSRRQLAERGGYPRLLRLQDSSLMVIYENRRGDVHLIRSADNGESWSAHQEVFSKFVYAALDGQSTVVNIANPEITQLANGDIVIACNYRPAKAEIAPYSIVIRRSSDNGETWQAPQNLYTAAPRFTDGCWEPSFLQLPNGELQVYFANENPYRASDEQEISMLSSQDNGISWSAKPKTVSFRKGRRDGMPVARLVGDQIVVVIEDNYIGQFKPYTVRTAVEDNWSQPVLADSPNRDHALDRRVADSVYMGAPYFLKLPNGETLISYQSTENRKDDWLLSTMEVAIGNSEARQFAKETRPFPVPPDKEAKWNSLALWDDTTVVALASSNFESEEVAPWLIKGHLIAPLDLKTEKAKSFPIFIGAQGESNLKAGIEADAENLYVECLVTDANLPAYRDSSAVSVFLNLNDQQYKIRSSPKGETELWTRKANRWIAAPLENKITTSATNTSEGYTVRFAVSKKLMRKPLPSFRLGLALCAQGSDHELYTEYLANMDVNRPESWLKVEL
jgi:hypothetical protein